MGIEAKYMVCTQCFTFNHAAYIEDALNGFVAQQTDFPVVYTIVDDASTDGEPQILRDFFNDSFDVDDSSVAYQEEADYGTVFYGQHKVNKNCFFAILLLKENHYSQKKSKLAYLTRWNDHAKYVALCEGDDYWIDPLKLQRQVDYLESHPLCMLVTHPASWRTGDEIYAAGCQDSSPKDYSIDELIRCGGYFFATASFVFRSELNKDWPQWRREAHVGDFPLQILAGLRGNVHSLPYSMCIYRYQSEGSWSLNQKNKEQRVSYHKNKIKWMSLLDQDTGHKHQEAIYDQLFQHYNFLYNLRMISALDYMKVVRRSGNKRYGRLLKDIVRIELTPVYRLLACFKSINKKYV